MKKFLVILLLTFFLITPTLPTFAQTESEEKSNVVEEVQEENVEEKETLSDKLESEDTEIQQEPTSFLTILAAILIPCLFLIICYLIFKFFKF